MVEDRPGTLGDLSTSRRRRYFIGRAEDVLDAVADVGRSVSSMDGYDIARAAEGWLRAQLLPRLPAHRRSAGATVLPRMSAIFTAQSNSLVA